MDQAKIQITITGRAASWLRAVANLDEKPAKAVVERALAFEFARLARSRDRAARVLRAYGWRERQNAPGGLDDCRAGLERQADTEAAP